MTTFRWYLLGLALLFGAYVAVEYYRPKPLDWTPTFQNKDKIPYGTYVLYDVLPEVLRIDEKALQAVRVPIYSQIEGTEETQDAAPASRPLPAADSSFAPLPAPDSADDAADEDAADYMAGLAESGFPKATYVFVNSAFELSRPDCRSLLRHVARGNDVFIAAEQFDAHFADTLGFRTAPFVGRPHMTGRPADALRQDSVLLQLSHPGLARQAGRRGFRLPTLGASYRLLPDSGLRATQLAADTAGRAVLLRLPHGRGHLYLCSVPLAFTNYFVLQPATSNLAFAALSYLPAGRPVWWDEYQKQGRREEQTLLRVLLAHDALRWALYLSLAGAALFVALEARRQQRVIPVLPPLPNTTLLFTRTIASLYRQGNSHQAIAEKKIGLFLEHLRTRFHEPGLDLSDNDTRERLAQKTGVSRADLDALVRRINFLRTAPHITDAELLALNKALNDFRKNAG